MLVIVSNASTAEKLIDYVCISKSKDVWTNSVQDNEILALGIDFMDLPKVYIMRAIFESWNLAEIRYIVTLFRNGKLTT